MKFDYGILKLYVIDLFFKNINGGELWTFANLF